MCRRSVGRGCRCGVEVVRRLSCVLDVLLVVGVEVVRVAVTANSVVHTVERMGHCSVPGAVLLAGTGAGGESIWGKKFKDDKDGLKLKLGVCL